MVRVVTDLYGLVKVVMRQSFVQTASSSWLDLKTYFKLNLFSDFKLSISYDEFLPHAERAFQADVEVFKTGATGEPFINKDFEKMLDWTIAHDMPVSIQTNLNDKLMRARGYRIIMERKDHIGGINTDLVSPSSYIQDRIKIGTHLKETLYWIKRILAETKIKFSFNTIVTEENLYLLENLPDLIAKQLPSGDSGDRIAFGLYSVIPFGMNSYTSFENWLSFREGKTQIVIDKMTRRAEQLGMNVVNPINYKNPPKICGFLWHKFQYPWPLAEYETEYGMENALPINCIATGPGKLKTIGSVSEHGSIMEFWNNDFLVNLRRNMIKGEMPDKYCHMCDYRFI